VQKNPTFTHQLIEAVSACVFGFPAAMIINSLVASTQSFTIVGSYGIMSSLALLVVHSIMTYKDVLSSTRTKVIQAGEVVVYGKSPWDTRYFAVWALSVVYWGSFVSLIFNLGYLNSYVSNSNTLMLVTGVILIIGFAIDLQVVNHLEEMYGLEQCTSFELWGAAFMGTVGLGITLLSLGMPYLDLGLLVFSAAFAGTLFWFMKKP
jgi:hypothetical protein